MLTAEEIENAKSKRRSADPKPLHEHDDCIRIAYEWLDAQTKTKGVVKKFRALKHIIEKWGGRYVSQDDVEVAAHMHPDIIGKYPHYNISAKLVLPSFSRLDGISEANKHQNYRDQLREDTYSSRE